MKTKLSPALVGTFVLGAILLAIVAFLSFGGSNVFAKPSRFLIYFDESVSGLELGAAVKLNGVRFGRVAAINVRYEQPAKRATVQTICEIDRNILTGGDGRRIDLSNPAEFQNLIDRGLRARLNLQGITGLLFVELDFEDPRKYPANPRYMTDVYPVVPAIPSPISELQNSIVDIVADIKKVDFPGLAASVRTVLGTANQKLTEFDVKRLADKIGSAADAIQELVGSPDAKKAFANLNTAMDEMRSAVAKIEAQTGPVSDELKQTLSEAQKAMKSLNDTASSTRRLVEAQNGLGPEVVDSLRQVAEAAAAIERLADYLERNPNALVVGRKKEARD